MLKVREKAVKTHSGILRRVSSCSPDPYTWFFHCHLLSQSHGQTKTLLWPGDTFVLEDVETPGHLLPRRGLQPLVPVYRVLLLSLVQRSHSEARGGRRQKAVPLQPKKTIWWPHLPPQASLPPAAAALRIGGPLLPLPAPCLLPEVRHTWVRDVCAQGEPGASLLGRESTCPSLASSPMSIAHF